MYSQIKVLKGLMFEKLQKKMGPYKAAYLKIMKYNRFFDSCLVIYFNLFFQYLTWPFLDSCDLYRWPPMNNLDHLEEIRWWSPRICHKFKFDNFVANTVPWITNGLLHFNVSHIWKSICWPQTYDQWLNLKTVVLL